MDKATLEFFIRDGLAAHAHQTGIVAGERAEIIVESVVQRLWPEVEKSRAEVERLREALTRINVLADPYRESEAWASPEAYSRWAAQIASEALNG